MVNVGKLKIKELIYSELLCIGFSIIFLLVSYITKDETWKMFWSTLSGAIIVTLTFIFAIVAIKIYGSKMKKYSEECIKLTKKYFIFIISVSIIVYLLCRYIAKGLILFFLVCLLELLIIHLFRLIINKFENQRDNEKGYCTTCLLLMMINIVLITNLFEKSVISFLFGIAIWIIAIYILYFIFGKDVLDEIGYIGIGQILIVNFAITCILIKTILLLCRLLNSDLSMNDLLTMLLFIVLDSLIILLFRKKTRDILEFVFKVLFVMYCIVQIFVLPYLIVKVLLMVNVGNVITQDLNTNVLFFYIMVLLYALFSNFVTCIISTEGEEKNTYKLYFVKKANLLMNFFITISLIVFFNICKFGIFNNLFVVYGLGSEIMNKRYVLHSIKNSLIEVLQVVTLVIAYLGIRNEKPYEVYYKNNIEEEIKNINNELSAIRINCKKEKTISSIKMNKLRMFGIKIKNELDYVTFLKSEVKKVTKLQKNIKSYRIRLTKLLENRQR